MNKMIKILLSVLIVSLSALVVPLVGHSANVKTDPVAVQAIVVESTENRDYEVIELSEVSINFEFYVTCLRVTFITSLFEMRLF